MSSTLFTTFSNIHNHDNCERKEAFTPCTAFSATSKLDHVNNMCDAFHIRHRLLTVCGISTRHRLTLVRASVCQPPSPTHFGTRPPSVKLQTHVADGSPPTTNLWHLNSIRHCQIPVTTPVPPNPIHTARPASGSVSVGRSASVGLQAAVADAHLL